MNTLRKRFLEQHVPGKRLGRHVFHDARSHAFDVEAMLYPCVAKSVEYEVHGDVLNQGELGSCTGNAAAALLNCEPFFDGTIRTEEDAIRIYSRATYIDNIIGIYDPPKHTNDSGSSGLAVMKVAKKDGLISGYFHAFSLSAALRALQATPVITGISWFEGFDSPEGANAVISISGAVRGGHELLVRGVDVENGFIKLRNSWGTGWGNKGDCLMSFATWKTLLSMRGDVTVARPMPQSPAAVSL